MNGLFETSMLLSLVANQAGYYQEAASWLEMAKQRHGAAHLDERRYIQLLHQEAGIEWYKGNFAQAIILDQAAKEHADRHGLTIWQAFTRLVLGNLYRAAGKYAAARSLYDETEDRTLRLENRAFMPWIKANTAWLDVLEGRLDRARNLLYSALDPPDFGREMSINVFLAVVDSIEARFHDAEQLFLRSLDFYHASGDGLSLCAIRFHLASIYLRMNRVEEANRQLTEALHWCRNHSIDYFPHWWHPTIVSEVCAHALANNLHPHIIERMCIKHLRLDAVSALRPLLSHPSELVRRRVGSILDAMGEEPVAGLNGMKDRRIREVLKGLLETGRLRVDGYEPLKHTLRTAAQRDSTNPVILATFGLYVHGRSQQEIATMLDRSAPTVRNAITAIYDSFDLSPQHFRTREDRRRRLRELAREEGFS
jgi:tetratricopeptide (TPR) repeat protein